MTGNNTGGTNKVKLLFVCTGNTCRSPMAESYAAHLAMTKGLDLGAESAGFSAFDGDSIAEQSEKVLAEKGIPLKTSEARRFTPEMGQWASLIYVMTPQHVEYMNMRYPDFAEKTKLLGEGIADPFGKGISEYRQCFDSIAAAITKEFETEELILGGGLSC